MWCFGAGDIILYGWPYKKYIDFRVNYIRVTKQSLWVKAEFTSSEEPNCLLSTRMAEQGIPSRKPKRTE